MNRKLIIFKVQFFHYFYKIFSDLIYKNVLKKYSHIKIASIDETIYELVNSNKSLSRFGDGEVQWIFNENIHSFEKDSKTLSYKLLKVLNNNNHNLMIGLPDAFRSINGLTKDSRKYYKLFLSQYGFRFIKYLNKNKQYYNTNISRMYMDYLHKDIFHYRIAKIKELWNSKNVLLVEGNQSRFGVGNGLLNNANLIYRIECPATNAFESYDKILGYVKIFLRNNKQHFLVLISLGPTTTILSCDLCNLGYRAIDIGHLDVEYEWYLEKAKHKVNIPTRYVNEVNNGNKVSNVNFKNYKNQIIHYI